MSAFSDVRDLKSLPIIINNGREWTRERRPSGRDPATPLAQGDAPAGIELAGGLTQKTPPCVVVHAAPKEGGPRAARVRRRAGDLTQRQTSFASADSTVYPVDKTLGINAGQGAVFNVAARETVDEFLNGYNGTVLCYGQTGAGKTYTLSGDQASNDYEKWPHAQGS